MTLYMFEAIGYRLWS